MDGIFRLIGLLGAFFTLVMTGLMLLAFHKERPINIFSSLFSLLLSVATLPIFMLLSGARLNLLLAFPIMALGLLVGFLRGQATRLYYKGGQVMGQYSLFILLGWGGSLALSQLFNIFGSALLASLGLLPLILSTGTQVGNNANIFIRRLFMRPSAEAVPIDVAPHSQLSPRFAVAKRRFSTLLARYQARELDAAAYHTELQKLVIEDTSGGYWAFDADSGNWRRFNGQEWVREMPPSPATQSSLPSVAAPHATASGKHLPRWLWLLAGLPVLAIVGVALLVAFTPYPEFAYRSLAIQVDPENPAPYWKRALIYRYDLDNLTAAAEDISTVINLEPTAYRYQWRAEVYQEIGETSRALADYTTAISMDPNDADLYVARGQFYQVSNDLEGALADYQKAISLEPDRCYFTYLRGELHASAGRYDQARQDLQDVLQDNTEDCQWMHNSANRALAGLPTGQPPPGAGSFPTPDPTTIPDLTPVPASAEVEPPWEVATIGDIGINIFLPSGWKTDLLDDAGILIARDPDYLCYMDLTWYPVAATATDVDELQGWMDNHPVIDWSPFSSQSTPLGELIWTRGDAAGTRPVYAAMIGPTGDNLMLYWWGQVQPDAWDSCAQIFEQIFARASYVE